MGQELHKRIETWKKLLLDFGKRNRLINFKEGKRSNVRITAPSYDKLFDYIAVREKEMRFPYAKKTHINDEGEEIYDEVIKGDIETSKPIGDLQKTLKALRYRANTSIEEQGINILFLAFGLLKWAEREDSTQTLMSPIILVPVKLIIESLTSPYKLIPHEDEIVVNPTLLQKLGNDFGINFPEFDELQDGITEYLDKIELIIKKKGWEIERCVHLTNLSFLKINMYKDLERNEERLNSNPVISAIAGEHEPIQISEGLDNFDHDKNIRPIDTFQVVDADSSQQDAVLLSKRGVSFVLQGPPGTGKSQTITNIISEAIADGKKVLFVSEKMAALQVVYNRLVSVGLGDFGFTLHSHKANKKEILNELANSISIDRKKVTDEALTQLHTLERKRACLNDYQQELHTPCSGLNKTIFEINGQLAKLSDIPEVIFGIEDVEKSTTQELDDRVYLLRELSKTIGKRSENYADNVWRNSTIKFLSNELRHDIDSNISMLLPLLLDAEHILDECCVTLDISINHSADGLDSLIKALTVAQNSPLIPVQWILDVNISQLLDDANRYKVQSEQINRLQKELQETYAEQFFDCDGEQNKQQLSERANVLLEKVKSNSVSELAENAHRICSELSSRVKETEILYRKACDIADAFGINTPSQFTQIKRLNALSKTVAASEDITPTDKWFEASSLREVKQSLTNCKSLHEELAMERQTLQLTCDKEIFAQDFYPMLQRFRSEYTSSFRMLRRKYREDMRTLRHYLSNGAKLTYKEALNLLNSLKVVADKTKEIEVKQEQYIANYGQYYNGLETRWDVLQEALNLFEPVVSVAADIVPSALCILYKEKSLPIVLVGEFNSLCEQYPLDRLQDEIIALLTFSIDDNTSCEHIISEGKKVVSLFEEFIEQYDGLRKLRCNEPNYDVLLADLNKLAFIQTEKKHLLEQRDNLSMCYETYYANEDTNWCALIDALKFAKDFKAVVTEYRLPDKFVQKVCIDKDFVTSCRMVLSRLAPIAEAIDKPLKWYISLFDDSESFYTYSFVKLTDRLKACKDKKYLLEEWVDYCANKQRCEEAGLLPYITDFEKKEVNPDYLVDAYLKRFYRLWLDAMMPKFPAVLNFRGRIQEQTIKEFCQLDTNQFKIAQARVRERAVSRIPDFNAVTSTRDEIGILKRELNKQRRLMPLRKLFMTIPNLITSLRPCFMMSPLSVSVFLEAQSYDFDLVIFDEASQVHTEDAIGAIMRGKQVIIVGDTQQLPPTNFFASSLNDEDFDNEEEDDDTKDCDAGAYDSILEEAVTVLPERSLRWHYRSRHEHLIAFSNIKIYNGSLITFPASIEKAPDCGVEYIYVSDGVYDRSGKRNNVIEARKVADLVFEHFCKYPNRSLGVVTFSEAQQNAVDAAIRQKRYQNAAFENYFVEEKEEPFFIKNLENVQGDERDTIIFSIGYAKDARGIMYMNFGPLSREGGYRRLNVAITRAKYNVKLVGSIVPTDIDIEKTTARGVKLLRSYIEFAQNGIAALEKELTFDSEVTFDSPFEESVYDFLQTKGYNVVTQVGCSGFRIDMAVKHPVYSGRFVIGIECDGAAYHSSRTARERDRLRQTVLEDMGWTIYRIWSTDWIKDQRTEEQKLVVAIEKALGRAVKMDIPEEKTEIIESSKDVIIIEKPAEISAEKQKGYGFVEYQQANIFDYYPQLRTEDIIKKVIEIEQPIHFEELCRRVAPLYGYQKASTKMRNWVQLVFKNYLPKEIKQEKNFISLVGFDNLQVRIPNSIDGYIRPITNISDDELSLAMKTIVEHSFGIVPEDLFIETSRVFGFKRTGENIVSSLRRVYTDMLINGQFKEVDGKVCII
ncbi:DUF3320 domain-containing protein [bacterium]|nr:DUF3320 domain-containing protein [bacterium]